MPKYRIESTDTTTITRETWIEAESPEDAKAEAEGQDWRTWSEVGRDTEAGITMVEDEDGKESE